MFAALDFKITSTKRGVRATASGMTLAEVVIAVALAAMAATTLLILSASTGRSLAEMFNYVDLDHVNRVALDNMTKELRQVTYITSFSPTAISFMDKDGTPLSFVYSPAGRTLSRVKNGQSQALLVQCDQLQFAIYQRNPIADTFDLVPVTQLTNCKVVKITWSCSRKLFGRITNTEQGQSARVVIRNKKQI
jgi:hypothetical protein